MTLLHGTKHPYQPGDTLVPGGIVAPCIMSEDNEPTPGCDCGCDGRWMIYATTNKAEARRAALNRACMCPTPGEDHRPRIFEVLLADPEPDPNGWGEESVMGTSGRVIRPVEW